MKRSIGRSGLSEQGVGRAGADAGEAERAALGVVIETAERRAGASGMRSTGAGRGPVQLAEGELEDAALGARGRSRPGSRGGRPSGARSRAARSGSGSSVSMTETSPVP